MEQGFAHHAPPTTESAPGWLRDRLSELTAIERPSASEGEREAAEWIVTSFAQLGVEARIEPESAHGTYWWPVGLCAAAGALAGLAALRGRRRLAALLGAGATAAMADDFPPHHRRLRRLLPSSTTYNVVAELGPREAERTVVVIAHHDAAHSGLVFHPAIPETVFNRLGVPVERFNTSPALMAPVIAGPLLGAVAGLCGSRAAAKLALLFGGGSAAAMADIGSRAVVPAANDNGTAVVALLAIARRLLDTPPGGLRVILLSVGSEESFSEGIKAFGERHFAGLPRESTFFVCLETVGSPILTVLRGEGFLRMYEYPADALALVDGLASELGIELMPDLRTRSGTDGLEPLAAGYPTATLCSVTELKQPANYHWPTDTAENVNYGTLADAIRLCEAVIRRLDERWL